MQHSQTVQLLLLCDRDKITVGGQSIYNPSLASAELLLIFAFLEKLMFPNSQPSPLSSASLSAQTSIRTAAPF
jgi:hypothetical protein